jgi:hypothetical protein
LAQQASIVVEISKVLVIVCNIQEMKDEKISGSDEVDVIVQNTPAGFPQRIMPARSPTRSSTTNWNATADPHTDPAAAECVP